MRVVFLTHNFPRFEGDPSGAFLATLASALRARGTDVRVVAPSDGGQQGEPELLGVPVRRVRYAPPDREVIAYRGTLAGILRAPGRWPILASLLRALRSGAREELARGAQLVHAHWWVPGGLAAPVTHPMVLTVHGTDGALLGRSALARAVARPVFRRARVVTAVSSPLARVIETRTGRRVGPEWVAPMPVEVSRYSGWSKGGEGAVVVARLTAQKRVHLALQALPLLADRGHNLALTIIGDGPERAELELLAGSLGLGGQVHFAGLRAPTEVSSFLLRADLMFFPAVDEGFGLAAAEALMTGVPVVACQDGGGVLDIVPTGGAGRVAEATPAALAQAAAELLEDPAATANARHLGELWRDRLSPERIATRCEAWYHEALGG